MPQCTINLRANLQGEFARGEGFLNNSIHTDESFAGCCIDVHCVLKVRYQKQVDWVQHTELPVCCYDERLHHCMCTCPAIDKMPRESTRPWSSSSCLLIRLLFFISLSGISISAMRLAPRFSDPCALKAS